MSISYAVFCLKKKNMARPVAPAGRAPRLVTAVAAVRVYVEGYTAPRDLHSFPTRRSSDLRQGLHDAAAAAGAARRRPADGAAAVRAHALRADRAEGDREIGRAHV